MLLERIVKGSDKDVKTADLTEDDNKKVGALKDVVSTVLSEKKISLKSLTDFLSAMKDVAKMPENLI